MDCEEVVRQASLIQDICQQDKGSFLQHKGKYLTGTGRCSNQFGQRCWVATLYARKAFDNHDGVDGPDEGGSCRLTDNHRFQRKVLEVIHLRGLGHDDG
eukprot:6491500-Amphidinium_carterae.5